MPDNRTLSERFLNANWLFDYSMRYNEYIHARRYGKVCIDCFVSLCKETERMDTNQHREV